LYRQVRKSPIEDKTYSSVDMKRIFDGVLQKYQAGLLRQVILTHATKTAQPPALLLDPSLATTTDAEVIAHRIFGEISTKINK
jgi:hypothetical protein